MVELAILQVQLCYAAPELQVLQSLEVAAGCTIGQAIVDSGLLRQHPGIDLTACKVAIYGKLKSLDTPLRAHDRIEICRPLIADPMESRRRRVVHRQREQGNPG